MDVLEMRALRGPNRFSRYPTILLLLDIGDLEDRPSDQIPGFNERLLGLLPSLDTHGCSLDRPGGFVERLRRGTWAGHVVEHVALELQCLAGMDVAFGKTRETKRSGVYSVVFRYRAESVGLAAGRHAVDIVEACVDPVDARPVDITAIIDSLKELRERDMLGPSTASIVDEARSRGIPAMRLNDASFVQLGFGARQRRIQATMTDRTSALGVEIADEKIRTKEILDGVGIPVPRGLLVSDVAAALAAAGDLGGRVVVKPAIGNHGRGITVGVETAAEIETAFAAAQLICDDVIVERCLEGYDYRLLIIDNQFVAAARREPAHVIGDGRSSIAELIDRVNEDPRRGFGHRRILTEVTVDRMTERLLKQQGLGLGTVPAKGRMIALKSTANLSTGGTAHDATDEVHPEVRFMAERISRLIGLDCMGIDIVAEDLTAPLDGVSSGIVEVNAAPGFRMHVAPTHGQARNVAAAFVDMLFPPGTNFVVPIVAVTGTNGKTTTARLVAHTLKYAGHTVGLAGTNGVEIDGTLVVTGDCSGPESSRQVLQEPIIDHAVLEVARGGILRRGLGFDSCTVGVLLNVADDHLGVDGVETLEELALVKSTVVEVVEEPGGTSVLNADDEIVVGLRERARGQVIFFSLDEHNPVVGEHVAAGGTAVVLVQDTIVLRTRERDTEVIHNTAAPITFGGTVPFNTANVLAAVAALEALALPVESIRAGVMTFHASSTQNPGRMNLIDFRDFKVLLDYAHNVPAVQALRGVLTRMAAGRKLVVAHGTGSRTEEAIRAFGRTLAKVYDEIVVADVDPRHRGLGETSELVRQGALSSGFPAHHLHVVVDPLAAVDHAFSLVKRDDILVVQVDKVEPMLARVMEHRQRLFQSD